MTQIENAHFQIREIRAIAWKRKYCREHALFRKDKYGFSVLDISAAPEPTDEELGCPEPMVTVKWPTGYITMTLTAYNKLSAKDKKVFNKLGGLM